MSYQGWKNYPTWCIALWINNEESSYRNWRDVAQDCWDESLDCKLSGLPGTDAIMERFNVAKCYLSERLKDHFEDACPKLDGFWADLTQHALDEVHWFEVATSLLEDIDAGTEENP